MTETTGDTKDLKPVDVLRFKFRLTKQAGTIMFSGLCFSGIGLAIVVLDPEQWAGYFCLGSGLFCLIMGIFYLSEKNAPLELTPNGIDTKRCEIRFSDCRAYGMNIASNRGFPTIILYLYKNAGQKSKFNMIQFKPEPETRQVILQYQPDTQF